MSLNIFAGENLMIVAPVLALTGPFNWRGQYDNTASYVPGDVVLGSDLNAYLNTVACSGVAPPNIANWEQLPPQGADTIPNILVELAQAGVVAASWEYKWIGDPLTAAPLVDGHNYVIVNFGAGDDFTNVGGSNVQGDIFTATGTTPTTWTHGSILREVTYPPNFLLQNGLLQAELLKETTKQMSGLYEERITISSVNTMYIQSGAQTDVNCIADALKVTPC